MPHAGKNGSTVAGPPETPRHVGDAGPRATAKVPTYQRIKDHVRRQISQGVWKEGDLISTELALCREFGVSRMTVHRALRELTADNLLVRYQGSGTYVAPTKIPSTLIEIRSIAEDIRDRGHRHSCRVLLLEKARATTALARQTGLAPGAALFRSQIVHYENDTPIQFEDRVVDAQRLPQYLEQNWAATTPNEYLMRMAPLPTGHYTIEVKLPPKDIAGPLDIGQDQPCLVLDRVTYSGGAFASQAIMWYPGNRYKLAGQI